MRVSTATIADSALRRLQERLTGLQRSHEQLATGKRILRPSDDPAGTVRVMGLHSGVRSLEQASRNADDAIALTRRSDDTLQSMIERLQRARQLTVEGANTIANGPALAAEIEAIEEDLVTLANTTHRGRGIFAGTAGGDAIGGPAGARTYSGDAGAVRRRIGENVVVQVNVTADDVLGIGSTDDVLATLNGIAADLRAGDHGAVGDALDALDAGMDRIGDALATVGAAGRRAEAARERALGAQLDTREEVSRIEDVDVAETVMNLELEQATYQAALSAFGRSLQLSITDFLR